MKLHIVGTANRRISIFDIRFFKVSFPIRLAAFQASGAARMKLRQNGTVFLMNEAPRSRAARYQRGLKAILYWKGHVVSPSKLTPSSYFTPQQSYEEFLMIKPAASMTGPGLNSKQIERRTSVSFSIRPAVFLAGGWADT
jgi:hypothetical protein